MKELLKEKDKKISKLEQDLKAVQLIHTLSICLKSDPNNKLYDEVLPGNTNISLRMVVTEINRF